MLASKFREPERRTIKSENQELGQGTEFPNTPKWFSRGTNNHSSLQPSSKSSWVDQTWDLVNQHLLSIQALFNEDQPSLKTSQIKTIPYTVVQFEAIQPHN